MHFAFGTLMSGLRRPAAVATGLAVLSFTPLVQTSQPATAGTICAATTTTVCVVPSSQTVAQGSQFEIDVAVEAVSNLGAFQFTLNYDPAIMRLVSATSGSFIRSTGRDSNCSSPPPGSDDDGSASFWCTTLGTAPPPGASGSGILYHVRFNAVNPGTTELTLSKVLLTTPDAHVIPTQTEDGSVSVTPATPTPTATPCVDTCPTATPTSTSTPTPTIALQGASVHVEPLTQTVGTGSVASVGVAISDVSNLGAYQFTLEWDPTLLKFAAVQNEEFLGSTGRSVFCPEPQVVSNSVTFGCATFGSDSGPSGSGLLATVQLTAVTAGTSDLVLPPEEIGLTDPLGTSIRLNRATPGEITIVAAPTPTPTPCPDNICPTPTPTNTPTPTATPVSFPVSCDGTETAVCVQPASQSVTVGQPGEIVSAGVVVANVSDLGGFQFRLNFNPDVVTFSSIDIGAFLGSTGRPVDCAPPDVTSSSLTLVCATRGSTPPGPSGSGVLAVVHFAVAGSGTSALGLSNVKLATIAAVSIPTGTQDGSINVSLATPTPCPDDCPTPTATPTPTPTLSPTPTPTLDPSGCPTLSDPTICVQPGSQTVENGAEFTVDLVVNNVSNLGAYEFTITFDPIRVGFVNVVNSTFLGSTGRAVSCIAPIVDLGSVRYACATVGPSPAGPSGSGILATVTFSAANIGTTDLSLPLASLAEIDGTDIPVTAFGAEVHIE